jgi:hypothetical protein
MHHIFRILHPATNPHPGDFEIGSLESRAAARILAERIGKKETVIQVVYVGADGARENGPLLRFPIVELPDAEQRVALLAARIKRLETAQEEPLNTGQTRVEYHKT